MSTKNTRAVPACADGRCASRTRINAPTSASFFDMSTTPDETSAGSVGGNGKPFKPIACKRSPLGAKRRAHQQFMFGAPPAVGDGVVALSIGHEQLVGASGDLVKRRKDTGLGRLPRGTAALRRAVG